MKTIVLISLDMVMISIIDKILEKFYRVVVFMDMRSALDYIYNSIPDLMIVDIMNPDDQTIITVLNSLKEDPIFSQLPVLTLLADTRFLPSFWESLPVEDFLRKSDIKKELILRVSLAILRSERVVEINPLTRLPGNIAINKQIQSRLDGGREFSLAYADLDYFKPFNDYYGFSRGDEVLKMAGRLIGNMVKSKQPKDSFVGHIGGDDFVFIMNPELAGETAKEIIRAFDRIVPTFYNAEDRKTGLIMSRDRQGNRRSFPVITISIGIALSRVGSFSHYGELAGIASEMNSYAKHLEGSCFVMDRRHNRTSWRGSIK
ncbi:MAG: diguanylate cyclase [Syntrophobacterales bacterium]|jgi:diguanylate cyclase (GGDEF)-like protein|nr:diguanylate cyclase [Syntrophobacterales bacterium]